MGIDVNDAKYLSSLVVAEGTGTKTVKQCIEEYGKNGACTRFIDELKKVDDVFNGFIENIMNIKSFDPLIGEYLKLKCFYRLSDDAIARRINVSLRSVANYKSKAFYYLAIYTNQVEFIEERVYQFYLD